MTRVYWIISFTLIAITVAVTAWLYGSLPEQIPTHWNIRGEIDGYGGKWTLFIFPVMMFGMLALFYFLPALSPKQFEVTSFRSTYLYIMVLCTGLFAYMAARDNVRRLSSGREPRVDRSGASLHRGHVFVLCAHRQCHGESARTFTSEFACRGLWPAIASGTIRTGSRPGYLSRRE